MVINKDLKLDLNKTENIEINGDDISLDFNIVSNANMFVKIEKVNKLFINVNVLDNIESTIFFWNETDNLIYIKENYILNDNSRLNFGFGECNDADSNIDINIDLNGVNSFANVASASLVRKNKNYNIKVVNNNIDTIAQIKNHAVVLNNGKLMIDAVGKINNGAHRSESHQESRAICFEEGSNATILPELLIDENDVKASHAMSIGRMDENQLYYMMSRGLDNKECTALISLGYLIPVTNLIKDEDLKINIQNELERKIKLLCSI